MFKQIEIGHHYISKQPSRVFVFEFIVRDSNPCHLLQKRIVNNIIIYPHIQQNAYAYNYNCIVLIQCAYYIGRVLVALLHQTQTLQRMNLRNNSIRITRCVLHSILTYGVCRIGIFYYSSSKTLKYFNWMNEYNVHNYGRINLHKCTVQCVTGRTSIWLRRIPHIMCDHCDLHIDWPDLADPCGYTDYTKRCQPANQLLF
jgi:hypothetical protein